MLAVRSGVLGFVARSAGPAAIEQALHDVHAGRAHGLAGAGIETSEDPPLAIDLTLQESRVLVLLDQGLRFRQIASEMRISESTAKGYARNLFGKLGATSRSEAVYFARRCGLLGQLASGGELRELSGVP
jgi:DNA-binding NarL/FixJ family response regulator